ncbi:MAG: hypothetical protein H7Y10_04915 [Flavobacterium sp.]|nr:hypothetical protein [Flavobacterium sp.]
MKNTIAKIKCRLWGELVFKTRKTSLYPYIYKSYWNYLFSGNKNFNYEPTKEMYYAAWPNQGAGIGHQIDVWCHGVFISKDWGLKFAYLPFSKEKWDIFLGFGEDEISVKELRQKKYKIRTLPYFNVDDLDSVKLNKQIIASYQGEKIVFIAEVDQPYSYSADEKANFIRDKFISASSRVNDKVLYDRKNYNIAVHIRRGDIMADFNNPNLTMRFLNNDYYDNVLKQVVENIITDKPINIYIYSQGKPGDFTEFNKYKNLIWCLDVSTQNSFANLVYADVIITSKSSFSYDPALISDGIKLCPKTFWIPYPERKEWILCDDDGTFDVDKLKVLFKRD